MRHPGCSAICINEYVKNIRLHTFAPTFAIFPQKILEYFPQKFLGIYSKYNRVLKVEDYQRHCNT